MQKKNLLINDNSTKSSFIPTMIVVCLLTYARDNLGLTIPIDVFTIILGIGFLFFQKKDFIAFGVIEPLFYNGIRTTWVFLIAIIIYYIKYGKISKLTKYQAIILVLMIIEIFHIVIEPFDFGVYGGYFISYWYLAIMLGEIFNISNNDKQFVLSAYVLNFLFVMVDILQIFLGYYGSLSSLLTGSIRFGNIDQIHWFLDLDYYINLNENTVALFAIVSMAICFMCTYRQGKRNNLWIIGLVLSLFFGLATMSRAFLICLVFFIVLWGIIFLFKKRVISKKNLLGPTLAIISFSVGGSLLISQLSNIFDRFRGVNITGSRDAIFKLFNDFLFAHPQYWIAGIGLQSIDIKIGENRVTHNAIQETYVCFGLLGLVIVVFLFICAFKDVKRNKGKLELECLVPFLVYFAFIQTIQFVRLSSVYLLLPLVSMAASFDLNENRTIVDMRGIDDEN